FSIDQYKDSNKSYTVGDEIPISGESYHYPDSFDVLVLRDKVAIKIRDKIITEIMYLDDYCYTGYPLTNGRGFAIQAFTQPEFEKFMKEYSETDERREVEFLNRWVKFDTYRRVIFHNNFWDI
ncbi:MAG: sulfate adenylyltransferase, partial [Acetobacterium sp.]